MSSHSLSKLHFRIISVVHHTMFTHTQRRKVEELPAVNTTRICLFFVENFFFFFFKLLRGTLLHLSLHPFPSTAPLLTAAVSNPVICLPAGLPTPS